MRETILKREGKKVRVKKTEEAKKKLQKEM